MRKYQKQISRVLVFLMVLALLPVTALLTMADAAYYVLAEPSSDWEYMDAGEADLAVVWRTIYEERATGRQLTWAETEALGNWQELVDQSTEYRLLRATDGGFQTASAPYDSIQGPYADKYYIVRSEEGFGVINGSDEMIFGYDDGIEYFAAISDEGIALVYDSDYQVVIIDLNTGERRPFDDSAPQLENTYLNYGMFNNGLIPAEFDDDHCYKYVDLDGNIALPGPYQYAGEFSGGYACVIVEGDVNQIIDKAGNVILSDEGREFCLSPYGADLADGVASAYFRETYGSCFVDLAGNILDVDLDREFSTTRDFHGGYAVITWVEESEFDWFPVYAVIDSSGAVLATIDAEQLSVLKVSDTGVVWLRYYTVDGGLSAIQIGAGNGTTAFSDVEPGDYYYDAVQWAVNHRPQITVGMGDGTFGSDSTVTRGQAVTFLWRAMGEPEPASYYNPFEDVTEADYYYKAVLWAVEQGITAGTDETHFTPEQTCSTAHIVTFLYRAYNPGANGWYEEAAAWAAQEGILAGMNTEVSPYVDCPRADVVTLLYRKLG